MNEEHILLIASELNLRGTQVSAVVELFKEGGTVPFIARYRKEATGSLDEVLITQIRDRLLQLEELDKRRDAILKSLEENGHLTDELVALVMAASTIAELEDIYLPYKPKRRTRATIAKEKGLEPLADKIFEQHGVNPDSEALSFIDLGKGVKTAEEALSGARDIIAEKISENSIARAKVRALFLEKGLFSTKVVKKKEDEGKKYKDYFDWTEALSKAPSHRILAMYRAEKEGIIRLSALPPEEDGQFILRSMFVKGSDRASKEVEIASDDSYSRLIAPSIEREIRTLIKERADKEAISVFADNLKQLLLSPPLGEKAVLAIDPGFRTGCKTVCLDKQGKLLYNTTIFPEKSEAEKTKAKSVILNLCKSYNIEAIAIGNGTAGRETERFIKNIGIPNIQIVMVNESGASIYSASKVAREEFPDCDLTVRGAVSIGRRLQDPLAELVKIDAKSIGIGQYQHDVDQKALKNSLDDVVMSCVNAVGVEVNTASKELLAYVSGIGPQVARNIVEFRETNGKFSSRLELKKVAKLGPKCFEQAAGFLRIRNGENPLDSSAVHPESYDIVKKMAKNCKCSVEQLMKDDNTRKMINLNDYKTEKIGLPTLNDIMEELAKPGRDPREKFENFSFADNINSVEDVHKGMKLPGIITNITAFGAFCDIGAHQDGLIHISEMADKFIKDPQEIVKLNQKVSVTVLEVDVARKRISLSLKK